MLSFDFIFLLLARHSSDRFSSALVGTIFRHNCSSKLDKLCSRFAFAFTAKIIFYAHWWGGYKPPHLLFFRQFLSLLSCAPQWFILPVAWWEAQCAEVNFGIFCEECLHLVQHVISWRYDIEEVFDDAHIKINPESICWQVYPWSHYDNWYHGAQRVLFVPNAGMVTTKISC